MNLYIIFTMLIATSTATQQKKRYTFPSSVNYAKTADIYQSELESKQHSGAHDQSEVYANLVQYSGNPRDRNAKILIHQQESNPHGYQFIYETDNGIKSQETGVAQGKSLSVQGEYSYTGTDGQTYTVSYIADENGFRPSGAHLPTPPPIPEAILKSVEENAKQEANGIFDDGSYKHTVEQSPAQYQTTFEQFQPQHYPEIPQFHTASQEAQVYQQQSSVHPSQSSGHQSQSSVHPSQSSGHQSQFSGHQTQSAGHQSQSAVQILVPTYQSQGHDYQKVDGYVQEVTTAGHMPSSSASNQYEH